jgi:hypothetical protein
MISRSVAAAAVLLIFAPAAFAAGAADADLPPATVVSSLLLDTPESRRDAVVERIVSESAASPRIGSTAERVAGKAPEEEKMATSPRAWVTAEAPRARSETRYDAPAGTGTATRLSISSSTLFGETPLALRVLFEGRADRTDPEITFRGAAWRLFRGERDAWWFGMETDDAGENRATFSLEYAF